jgi:hypothetical protein
VAGLTFLFFVNSVISLSAARFQLSLNLGVPNRSGIFAHTIRNLDLILFVQSLPLRSIGADFDRAAVVAHPDLYDPLFVIGRPLVFDFLALLHGRDVILPDYNRVAIFLFARPDSSSTAQQHIRTRSIFSFLIYPSHIKRLQPAIPIAACSSSFGV